MSAYHKPRRAAHTNIIRICLRCDQTFQSTGPLNRLCVACHKALGDAATPEEEHRLNAHAVREPQE